MKRHLYLSDGHHGMIEAHLRQEMSEVILELYNGASRPDRNYSRRL
jgi:hypothetical protein